MVYANLVNINLQTDLHKFKVENADTIIPERKYLAVDS